MIDLQASQSKPAPSSGLLSQLAAAASAAQNLTASSQRHNDALLAPLRIDHDNSPKPPSPATRTGTHPGITTIEQPATAAGVTPEFSTADLARFVLNSEDLYGTRDATATTRAMEVVSTRHKATCNKFMLMVFKLLEHHASPQMRSLAEFAEDPESGIKTRRLYLHLRGEPTEARKQLLNAVLVIFSHWFRKGPFREKPLAEMTEKEIADVSTGSPFVCSILLDQF
jgi:hypothetical protein